MVTVQPVKRFLLEKFWKPVVDESVFYNPFNTAAYSVLFALAAAYIGYPLLKKMEVSLDRKFFTSIAPFVFLGGAVRSLKDIDAINTILLETPFIYLLMFGIVVGSLVFSRKAGERFDIDYHRLMSGTGIALLILVLPFFSISNIQGLSLIAVVTLAWMLPGYLVLSYWRPGLLSYSVTLPIIAHYMDATVTSVALMFPGTQEKHVLASLFIEIMGPIGMFVMKTLIIIPAVIYINRNVEGDEKRYYLFLIAVLGFAIATRNFLSFITLS